MSDTATPSLAVPCSCESPLGDPDVGTCVWCGHQVKGREMPERDTRSTAFSKRRRRELAELMGDEPR